VKVGGVAVRHLIPSWLITATLVAGGWAGMAQAQPVTAKAPAVAGEAIPDALMASRLLRAKTSARVWRSDTAVAAGQAQAMPELSTDPAVLAAGRRIYHEGVRADGQPLVGLRLEGQVRITGASAACVLCHRRSALGAVEGPNQISPVSGRYLFDQDRRAVTNMNLRSNKSFNRRHEPYDLASLAAALRKGTHQSGRALDPLMPRYEMTDAEVLAVASYLRGVSNTWSPGVSEKVVNIATIITPDADPERRRIFLDMVNGIVGQKNGNLIHGQRTMSSGAEMVLQTDRSWDLQVWELQGPASTWQAQLAQRYAQKPVFAIVSGLGAGNWAPVHAFCEVTAVPCWFPSVAAVPADSDAGFYSMYFTRGVGLEADVLAQRLEAQAKSAAKGARLLQVYADDGIAASAVKPLADRMAGGPLKLSELRLSGDTQALSAELAKLGERDSVVFWLSPQQLGSLGERLLTKATPYFSASLAGGEGLAVSPAWRVAARVIYPYQLPELRQRGMTVFRELLRVRNLKLEDELLQSEVYFSLNYFNDTMVDMLDNVHRDYLLERGENMLSLREAARAEDEARDLALPKMNLIDPKVKPLRQMTQRMMIPRNVPRPSQAFARDDGQAQATGPIVKGQGPLAKPMTEPGHSDMAAGSEKPEAGMSKVTGLPESTNVYPRLSLGQRQRHASKGAYIVRLDADTNGKVRAETDWVIP
jgi:hypothetical protein